jgi:hypothetical protein
MTFAGQTFASLGVIRGAYVWTRGAGANAGSLTLKIRAPEPSTWAMLLIGFAASPARRAAISIV